MSSMGSPADFTKRQNMNMALIQAPYACFLELVGVGYKANIDTQMGAPGVLVLKLGFSHDVSFVIPPSVRVFCLKPTIICCVSTDLQNATQFAAKIQNTKPPEVYKGKGIRYQNETFVLKQGKQK